ncbi:DUF6069 family protein [Actinomadura sp. HBU206391]|uniref:DUF6069 family protein n=1 Tax=Actinomadura sp. HBU206391 TaxID=2731692 RepID=UPI00164F06A0|nr:DUF6069 family protein [Actinomadura sp. HBU206391]MBC6458357.1 hypothetical protein [Actinomadura sp. HBU206391]
MATQTESVRGLPAGVRRRDRAIGTAGALAAAVAVWAVGEPVLGYDLVVEQPGQKPNDLGMGAIAFVTLAASLLGWALLAGLERVTARAGQVWTVIALVVLVASFVPLIGVEASGGTKAVLALTHVAVGVVLIPVFRRTTAAGPTR